MKKISNEKIINLFERNGYSIVGEIKNSTTPIICEKDGFRYRISYHNLYCGKKASLWSFYNIENLEYNILYFIKKRRITSKFLSYKIIQHNKKKRILLTFKCMCGKTFNRVLEDAVYKDYLGCNDCIIKKRGMNRRNSDKNLAIVLREGYKILSDKNEISCLRYNDLIEVEDKDGFRGFISASKIQSKKGMSRFDLRINKKYYVYNVNNYARLNNMNVECVRLVEKKHQRQSLEFKCSCGNTFITSISSFQQGKQLCEKCTKSISSYEIIFREFLEEYNIDYIYQYSLNQCRDILPLPFDFYLIKYDVLIEIDGEGHFHPCNFNKISNKEAIKSFELTKKHDKIKDEYCKGNNKLLLRIPYWYFNQQKEYQHIFQKFIEGVANFG